MIVRISAILLVSLFSIQQNLVAQTAYPVMSSDASRPLFPGGDAEMYKFIYTELKYPAEARKNEIEGQVFTRFQVMEDGMMDSIKVIRKLGYGCDEEALRIVEKMKMNFIWTPGMFNGVPVAVTYTLPIRFKLD